MNKLGVYSSGVLNYPLSRLLSRLCSRLCSRFSSCVGMLLNRIISLSGCLVSRRIGRLTTIVKTSDRTN